jgi:hypothetical protein
MTTPTQVGNRSPSMLVQVRFCVHSPLVWTSTLINAIDFRANKPSDVVSTLVSIYDSKDLFVKELQVLLAQRLLAVTDGNYEKEVASVSRLFFGDVIAHRTNTNSVGIWRSSKYVSAKLRCKFARSCSKI